MSTTTTSLPSFGELMHSLRLSESESPDSSPSHGSRSPPSHHHASPNMPRRGKIARYQPYKTVSPVPESQHNITMEAGTEDEDEITYIGTNYNKRRQTYMITGPTTAATRPKPSPISIAPAPPISSYLRRNSPTSSSSPVTPQLSSSKSESLSPMPFGPLTLPTLPNFSFMPSSPPIRGKKQSSSSLPRAKSHASLKSSKGQAQAPRPSPASHAQRHSQNHLLPPAYISITPAPGQSLPLPSHPRHHHRGSGSSGGSMASMSSVLSRFTVSSASDEDTFSPWRNPKESAPRAMQPQKRVVWNASGYQYPAPR
ncbi:hypothetical protein FRB94_003093 [Tulasnella sp. JGI-2019a]|nr:hypothetical protein FRB94_003093 [Tulasnella sp. JGI-2019a]